ncbi:hypothetical protein JCM11491_004940 [Sporobolomyces phaffii]
MSHSPARPSYIAYTPKRHSTQTSIASVHQVDAPPPPPPTPPPASPSPSPRPPASLVHHSSARSSRAPQAPRAPSPRRHHRPPPPPPFQPLGVRRDRTLDFFDTRRQRRTEVQGQEERLERRLDKLLELHFPRPTKTTADHAASSSPSSEPTSFVSTVTAFADSLFASAATAGDPRTPRSTSPRRGGGRGAGGAAAARDFVRMRVAHPTLSRSDVARRAAVERDEQRLVKWDNDRDVSECARCHVEFGLWTRKHHCRLCGRIVCFLPPTPTPTPTPPPPPPPPSGPGRDSNPGTPEGPPVPTRRERCSTFLTYVADDQDDVKPTKRGGTTEAPRRPGTVVEVAPVEEASNAAHVERVLSGLMTAGANANASSPPPVTPPAARDERHKVRVCRDCLDTVLRHQFSTLPLDTPPWLHLYRVLKQLELEIDALLVEFQNLALELRQQHQSRTVDPSANTASSRPRPSVSETASLRARLLTNLASYDTLSKRLLSLAASSASGRGGELERLQTALGTRATTWLGDKLSLLRQLGSIEEISGKQKKHKEDEVDDDSGGAGGGVKSFESLLSRDELRRVRERVGQVAGSEAAATATPEPNGGLVRLAADGDEAEGDGQLGVLLEQEKLVQSYLEDANARRQFEDAASLQASLDELRREIDLLRVS